MITKTNDILQVPLLRRFSPAEKTIPSVQYKIITGGLTGKLTIVDFSHGSPAVRLMLEVLTLASMGKADELDIRVALESEDFRLSDEKGIQERIKEIRASRLKEDEYEDTAIEINLELLTKLTQVLTSNSCTLFSEGIIVQGVTRRPLDLINVDYFQEIWGEQFTKILKGISSKGECLGMVNNRYFFPEDVYIGREFRTLNSMNTMSGNNYVGYQSLKDAYYLSDHFRENPDFFSTTHCQCGSELVIRLKDGMYTVMQCINPYCYEKLSHSLADFARDMRVDGLGAITIMNAVRYISLIQLSETGDINIDYRRILNEKITSVMGDSAAQLWFEFLEAIKEYDGTLKDLVNNMNLPYLAEEASRVLHYDVLVNPELNPQVLAKEAYSVGKKDIKFVLNLWLNMDSIRYVALEMATKTHLEPVEEVIIYITKSVLLELNDGTLVKQTKKQFVDLINRTLRNAGETSVKIKLSGSLTMKCQALIADLDRNTGSCAVAESYGVPIYTSREFLQSLGGNSSGKERQ